MIECFNYIIDHKSIEKRGTLSVIQGKTFFDEFICSWILIGLTFASLVFFNSCFINVDFKHSDFTSCDLQINNQVIFTVLSISAGDSKFDKSSFITNFFHLENIKKFDIAFYLLLVQHFPDWNDHMAY